MPKRPPSSNRFWSWFRPAERARGGPVAHALTALISAYRAVLRPALPAACRFEPSCSSFASQAIATHGAWRGLVLSAGRVLRCHPWHPGGFDPVPPRGV